MSKERASLFKQQWDMAQCITRWQSATKEAQLPSQSADSSCPRSREAPATYRKILANFYNKRERVYSVGELLPLLSQNSPKFILTKALVSVPDRAFPRGKHEWVVRFGNEMSGPNESFPSFPSQNY